MDTKDRPIVIAIGSGNRVKVEAVEETIRDYPALSGATCLSLAVPSGIADQPLSLEEIIQGAKNRAKAAFDQCPGCCYSFGLESGLFNAPGAGTGYLEASICSLYDGKQFHLGLSCGFEVPPRILDLVLEENHDLSQACYHSGITQNAKLGAAEGLIGILSNGRVNRKEYTKQSVVMALIYLENTLLYTPEKT